MSLDLDTVTLCALAALYTIAGVAVDGLVWTEMVESGKWGDGPRDERFVVGVLWPVTLALVLTTLAALALTDPWRWLGRVGAGFRALSRRRVVAPWGRRRERRRSEIDLARAVARRRP